MKSNNRTVVVLALVGLTATFRSGYAADPMPNPTAMEADNTRVNRVDNQSGQPTADQAKQNLSDRDLMQSIRRAIVMDDSLSTYAHNVKIIARDGRVTLKGPVRSSQEVEKVLTKAISVAGPEHVQNQMTVQSDTH